MRMTCHLISQSRGPGGKSYNLRKISRLQFIDRNCLRLSRVPGPYVMIHQILFQGYCFNKLIRIRLIFNHMSTFGKFKKLDGDA